MSQGRKWSQKLFHPEESELRAVNAAHMLYLAKWIICSIFTHPCSRCLWARWLFFRATDISRERTRVREPSSETGNSSRGKNNKSPARFFLIQLSPRLFRLQEPRCIRDNDESDSEAVVFVILQTHACSGAYQRGIHNAAQRPTELTPALFDYSETSPQIKCSACETK